MRILFLPILLIAAVLVTQWVALNQVPDESWNSQTASLYAVDACLDDEDIASAEEELDDDEFILPSDFAIEPSAGYAIESISLKLIKEIRIALLEPPQLS